MKKVRHGLKYDVYEIIEAIALAIFISLLTWAVFILLVCAYR